MLRRGAWRGAHAPRAHAPGGLREHPATIAATHAASATGPQAVLQGVVNAEEEVVDPDDGALYTEHIDEGGDQDIEELRMHGDEDDEASRALRNGGVPTPARRRASSAAEGARRARLAAASASSCMGEGGCGETLTQHARAPSSLGETGQRLVRSAPGVGRAHAGRSSAALALSRSPAARDARSASEKGG